MAQLFKTKTINPDMIPEKWIHIDATGQRIGRLATVVAEYLLGKDIPHMRGYMMPKTKVVITNASKLDVSNEKKVRKTYTQYSGYPGGLRIDSLAEVLVKNPTKVIEHAIKGMLPKNIRGNKIFTQNLYVYAGAEHKHEAQAPVKISLTDSNL